MALLAEVAGSFVLGLLTPLTAACVLPLYPGFLTYLAREGERGPGGEAGTGLFGAMVVLGVLAFMTVLGILFTTVLQVSLTAVIGVVSPIAFAVLAVIGIVLLLDLEFAGVPQVEAPTTGKPLLDAFLFGFFFGAIVVPCNPAYIAVFFTRATLFGSPVESIGNFVAFGLGIGAPLLVFAVASERWSRQVIGTLVRERKWINRGSGAIMLAVSLYYLVVVFRVVPGL